MSHAPGCSTLPEVVQTPSAPEVVPISADPAASAPEAVQISGYPEAGWIYRPPVFKDGDDIPAPTEAPAKEGWLHQRRHRIILGVVALVVAIAVGVAVGVAVPLTQRKSGDSSTVTNNSSTDSGPTSVGVQFPFGSPTSFPDKAPVSVCQGTVCPQMLAATTLASSVTTTFLFALGTDGAMWYRQIAANSPTHVWKTSEWQSLGGNFVSQPASAAMGEDRIELFGVWADLTVRVRTYQNGGWAPEWTSLGGQAASPPVACGYGHDNMNVMMVGIDHAAWHKYLNDGSTWGPTLEGEWEAQGGWLSSSIDIGCAITAGGVRRFDIVGYGHRSEEQSYGMFFKRFNTSAGWDSDWSGGWGDYRGDPVVVTSADRMDYFGLGSDYDIYHTGWTQENGTTAYAGLGGNLKFQSAVAGFTTGQGRLDILAVGTDTRLKRKARIDGVWSIPWQDLGGYFNSAPTLVVLNDTTVAVFGIGPSGNIIHGIFDTSGRDWEQGRWFSDGGEFSLEWHRLGPA